jgi:hypothetical protein
MTLNGRGRWGVKTRTSAIVSGNDADAQAFITAAGITVSSQTTAINNLVVALKGYGLWDKMKAIYPFVGGTATTHKFNLKNPADSNAAFRLSFLGGWIHSSTGAKPNGTTGYADTFLVPNTDLTLNGVGISYYTRNFKTAGYPNKGTIMGAGPTPSEIAFYVDYSNGTDYIANNTTESTGTQLSGTRGFYHNTRIVSTGYKVYRNGIIKYNQTIASVSKSTLSVQIAKVNGYGDFTDVECSFSAIDTGLTDTEAANFYTAVETYQTTLGRQVGVPIVADTDAQTFLTAADITNTTQASAINTLVLNLKSYGLWDKMKAIYPMVGGTANSHKFNLKNPADSNAAFRLGFYGGMTHDSNGVSFGGSNGGAFTYFNPFLRQAKNDLHLSVYARIRTAGRFFLSNDVSPNRSYVVAGWTSLRATSTTSNLSEFIGTSDTAAGYAGLNGTSVGFSLGSRTSSTAIKYYKNTTSASGNGASHTADFVNAELTLNGNAGGGYYSVANYAFASLGNGLTDSEAANFYTAVQAYQTTLGRQV